MVSKGPEWFLIVPIGLAQVLSRWKVVTMAKSQLPNWVIGSLAFLWAMVRTPDEVITWDPYLRATRLHVRILGIWNHSGLLGSLSGTGATRPS